MIYALLVVGSLSGMTGRGARADLRSRANEQAGFKVLKQRGQHLSIMDAAGDRTVCLFIGENTRTQLRSGFFLQFLLEVARCFWHCAPSKTQGEGAVSVSDRVPVHRGSVEKDRRPFGTPRFSILKPLRHAKAQTPTGSACNLLSHMRQKVASWPDSTSELRRKVYFMSNARIVVSELRRTAEELETG